MSSAANRGRSSLRFAGPGRLGVAAVFLSLGAALISAQMVNSVKQPVVKPPPTKLEGYAVWYNVPPNSLAKRRAGKDELTAADDRLALGTKVRVTHLVDGKSVVVRITDRGVADRHALIDLCKEAAAQLGMLSEGSARVRLEVLPDDKLPAAKKAPTW